MTLAPTKSRNLTQRQLESTLLTAANALRGPVDPGDFKAYVFPVMFFKWISDNWDFEHAQAVVDFGAELTDDLESTLHTFTVPEGCHWANVIETTQHTGVALDNALQRLQQANPESLAGVFGDVNWANQERLPQTALKALLDTFHGVRLDPDSVNGDILGSAYEYLLREFAEASGKKAGEFFTPRHVVHLLVKILKPQPGESIADPACGSGGMLVETITAIEKAGGNPNTVRLHGQEINLTTSAIAKMNLYLHGLEDFKIARGDTFREPKLLEGDGLEKFDVVIANPPFSLQDWGSETWASDPYGRGSLGVPPPKNGDFAWIQHMIASMKDKTGRVGVVMPHGVLTRGDSEAIIRRGLLESDLLEAIIDLPSRLFYSTTLPVCLMIFRSEKPAERAGKVLFVDASRHFLAGKNQNSMSDEHIDAVSAAYEAEVSSLESVQGVNRRFVSIREIADNGWQLNVGAFISSGLAEAPEIEITSSQLLESMSVAASTLAIQAEAVENLLGQLSTAKGLKLGEQFPRVQLRKLLLRSRETVPVEVGGVYPCVGLLKDGMGVLDREPFVGGETTYKKLSVVRSGQVVYRTITAFEAPIAVIPQTHDEYHVSGVFPVFDREDALVSSNFMRWITQWKPLHSQMADRCKGTVLRRKTLSVEDFLDIEVPLPDIDQQEEIAEFLDTVAVALAASNGGRDLLQDVMNMVLTREMASKGAS